MLVGWFVLTFLLKPYTDALVRLYQPWMDRAARRTTKITTRLLIEALRLVLITNQLVPIQLISPINGEAAAGFPGLSVS